MNETLFIIVIAFVLLFLVGMTIYSVCELSTLLYTSIFQKAPYVPNDKEIVRMAFQNLSTKNRDAMVDLGSGDGRALFIGLKEFGFKKAYGYEIDFFQSLKSKFILRNFPTAKIYRDDFINKKLKKDSTDSTVIYLYMYPTIMKDMFNAGFFKQFKKGTEVVSCRFKIEGLIEDKVVDAGAVEKGYFIYYYTL